MVPSNSVQEYSIDPPILSTIKVAVNLNSSLEDSKIELILLDDADYQLFLNNNGDLSVSPDQRDIAETRWFGLINYKIRNFSGWHVILDNKHRVKSSEQVKQENIDVKIIRPYAILRLPRYLILLSAIVLRYKSQNNLALA